MSIADDFKNKVALDTFGISKKGIATNPQKAYMWEVHITDGGRVGMVATLLDNITAYAKSVVAPSRTVEPIPFNIMGDRLSYVGKETSPRTLELTFWDDESATIRRYFDRWFQLVYEDKTGIASARQDADRNIEIRTKDTTDTAFTSITKLNGCFPIEIGPVNYSYEASDVVEVTVTIQFDSMEFII
jgi:hypothetical protein